VQPANRLVAFVRVKAVAPGETRALSFDIDLSDKLGVYDVEAGTSIVEPGSHRIKLAESSSDAGASAGLNVTAAAGGTPAATRNLGRRVLASDFDDYSDVGGKLEDMELVSASARFNADTAVSLRQDGAWLALENVAILANTRSLTIDVGSDRAGALKVYARPVGGNPSALGSATPIATVALQDTRPVGGLATGLGIGPLSVIGQRSATCRIPAVRPARRPRTPTSSRTGPRSRPP
jgi:hypothetical protein